MKIDSEDGGWWRREGLVEKRGLVEKGERVERIDGCVGYRVEDERGKRKKGKKREAGRETEKHLKVNYMALMGRNEGWHSNGRSLLFALHTLRLDGWERPVEIQLPRGSSTNGVAPMDSPGKNKVRE